MISSCSPASRRRAEQLAHFTVEGRNIIGAAARHQALIRHDLLIHPVRPGILEIGLERWPRGHAPTARRTRLDHGPRAMTDRGHRLAAVKKGFHESDGLWLNAKGVWIN